MSYQKPSGAAALRLHLNENTAGCSPAVIDALRRLTPDDIATYPDYDETTSACATWLGVPDERVLLVNGLDEGLHLAAAVAARRHDPQRREVVFPEPAFDMYGVCADAVGLPATRIGPRPGFEFPMRELEAAAARATLIYLTDPNNPTGLGIPAGAVDRLAASAPDTMVLVDEAYADFSRRTLIGPLLDARRNVVIGRTFAKGHGLAALRIGALIGHPDALAPIRAIAPPFSLNIAACRALEAALGDAAWTARYVRETEASREAIYAWCDTRGFAYWRSEANFVLLRLGVQASAIVAALANRGVLIRDRSSQPGCDGCVRISAGSVSATTTCLTALEDVLATLNG